MMSGCEVCALISLYRILEDSILYLVMQPNFDKLSSFLDLEGPEEGLHPHACKV